MSEKGQITIPKACRERLGLRPGTVLDVRTDRGRLVAMKRPAEDQFHKWRGRGKLPGKLTVDQYLGKARA
ncbi:MAG: AbrB/MazE/SpoVT family DNA-binding domain-containing protein [Kiritimatiellae bacterium]|nr:AbrB/MazE/SpoVT family DNA-binding domain-containing protein [Kiritimatiellia bacterium]